MSFLQNVTLFHGDENPNANAVEGAAGFNLDAIGIPLEFRKSIQATLQVLHSKTCTGQTCVAYFDTNKIDLTQAQELECKGRCIDGKEKVYIGNNSLLDSSHLYVPHISLSQFKWIRVTQDHVDFPVEGVFDYYLNGSLTVMSNNAPRTQITTVEIGEGICIILRESICPANKTTGKPETTVKPVFIFVFKCSAMPAAKRARLGDGGA